MEQLTQENRALQLMTPLGEHLLLPTELDAVEGISRPFEFRLTCLSETPDVKFSDIVGQNVTVRLLTDTGARYFNGFVRRFRQESASIEELSVYSLDVVPWLWMLGRRTNCRIFQEMSVPDIIAAIFQGHEVANHDFRLTQDYEPRTYTVQYRETDLDFVQRLMEEEGMHYYFVHGEGEHLLMIADDSTSNDELGEYGHVRFHPGGAGGEVGEVVDRIVWEQQVRSRSVFLRDYDFENPPASTLGVMREAAAGGREEHELYDYPGRYVERDRGGRLAEVRIQEEVTDAIAYTGHSNVRGLTPGFHFAIDDHPRRAVNRDLLLVRVHHRVRESRGADPAAYENNFVAIPYETPYRPERRTRKPVVDGLQSAVVTGPDGEDIHTDVYGRVKVKFHWDRTDTLDDTSSCWLRVSMARAGKGWGDVALPHVGQEVLVDFLEGDPDRPIITGRVYNADNMPPKTLPDNKHKTVLQDDYGNQIVFDATPGDEHIRIHSPHHGSGLEVGKSVKYWTDSDTDAYTIGDRDTTTYGTDRSLFYGEKYDMMLGLKMSGFVGFGLDLWVGASIGLSVGMKTGIFLGGDASGSLAFKYSYTKGPEIAHGSNDFSKTTSGEIRLDSEEKVVAIGGKDNAAKLMLTDNGVKMNSGSDERPPQSQNRLLAMIFGAAAGLGVGMVAAGAATQAGKDKASDKADEGDLSDDLERKKADYDAAEADAHGDPSTRDDDDPTTTGKKGQLELARTAKEKVAAAIAARDAAVAKRTDPADASTGDADLEKKYTEADTAAKTAVANAGLTDAYDQSAADAHYDTKYVEYQAAASDAASKKTLYEQAQAEEDAEDLHSGPTEISLFAIGGVATLVGLIGAIAFAVKSAKTEKKIKEAKEKLPRTLNTELELAEEEATLSRYEGATVQSAFKQQVKLSSQGIFLKVTQGDVWIGSSDKKGEIVMGSSKIRHGKCEITEQGIAKFKNLEAL